MALVEVPNRGLLQYLLLHLLPPFIGSSVWNDSKVVLAARVLPLGKGAEGLLQLLLLIIVSCSYVPYLVPGSWAILLSVPVGEDPCHDGFATVLVPDGLSSVLPPDVPGGSLFEAEEFVVPDSELWPVKVRAAGVEQVSGRSWLPPMVKSEGSSPCCCLRTKGMGSELESVALESEGNRPAGCQGQGMGRGQSSLRALVVASGCGMTTWATGVATRSGPPRLSEIGGDIIWSSCPGQGGVRSQGSANIARSWDCVSGWTEPALPTREVFGGRGVREGGHGPRSDIVLRELSGPIWSGGDKESLPLKKSVDLFLVSEEDECGEKDSQGSLMSLSLLDKVVMRSLVMALFRERFSLLVCQWGIEKSFELTVRPELRENKQVQTVAVLRSYNHHCGGKYASSEKGTIRRLALKMIGNCLITMRSGTNVEVVQFSTGADVMLRCQDAKVLRCRGAKIR
ncbi:hypothetical protein ARMGADRAFT_1035393 [Armillaria gallica]|uniref:Uncharacterized protein n=1 Tax=Armillaria gallica TaxID=47427 RepID=A0A2H3CYF5_ARMGA|nr:hypothetical protein ARMGADRAFT_1035393 [Armillaria gallica]